jgi:hypothetical protein
MLTSGAARAFAAARAQALRPHGKALEAIEHLDGRGHGD